MNLISKKDVQETVSVSERQDPKPADYALLKYTLSPPQFARRALQIPRGAGDTH